VSVCPTALVASYAPRYGTRDLGTRNGSVSQNFRKILIIERQFGLCVE